ncbi:hypothetical protein BML2496_15470 [Providencia rettgeri]|nr:hypothetical protein BML2496_15470 [Providencia rettgeri]
MVSIRKKSKTNLNEQKNNLCVNSNRFVFSGSGIATAIPTHGLNKYCRDVVVRTVGKIYENRALIQCYFKDVPFLARV